MNYKYIFLFLIIISSIAVAVGQNGWFCQIPYPQANTLKDVYMFDENNIIAVGNYATILKSFNGGESWEVLSNFDGMTSHFYAIFFIDSINGWIVSKDGILKTVDGGISWQNNTIISGSFSDVFFINENIGWVTRPGGAVFKTFDGGINWNIVSNPYLLDDCSSIHFINDSVGFIVGGYLDNTPLSIYWASIIKTIDGGINWNIIYETLIDEGDFKSIYFINDNTGWVAGGGLILKTIDGGINWNPTYNNTNDLKHISFSDDSVGYAVGSQSILKSIDGGNSWFDQFHTNPMDFENAYFVDDENGWVIGVGGVMYKTDDGITWNEKSKGIYRIGIKDIFFFDQNFGWAVGFSGDSSSVIKTVDGGENWSKHKTSSITLKSVFFTDTLNGWTVGGYGAILKTNDGGENWISQTSNTSADLKDVWFINNNVGWIVGRDGTILKTTDGGQLWEEPYNVTGNFNSIFFIDSLTGWIGGNYCLKTVNGGVSWFNISIPNNPRDIFFIDNYTGWAVCSYGSNTIIKTNDGGITWQEQYYTGSLYSIFFVNNNIGWASGHKNSMNFIIKTIDGGDSWNEQMIGPGAGLYTSLYSICFIDDSTGWVAGDRSIYKTTDAGGGIINSINPGQELGPKFISKYILHQNYPNPFNSGTQIKFNLPKMGKVTIEVFNMLGQKIETILNKHISAGSHEIEFTAKDLPSGIYLYKIKANEFQEVKKMFYLK